MSQQRTIGLKRVMLVEEKKLYDKRMREEENDYYRKRLVRDQIDQEKKKFKLMK